jgi:hypothetical protein
MNTYISRNGRSVLLTLLVGLCCLSPTAHAEQSFPKDAEVRLTTDTPLLFQSTTSRVGKAGEIFTVIQHNTTTKRVYILTTDGTGKQVALNVAETALEIAPLNLSNLRITLQGLLDKTDFDKAAKVVEAAASRAPNDPQLREYQSLVLAAKEAHDKLIAAAKKAEAANQRVQQLARNAQVGNRTNPLTGDQSGIGRAQQMRQEADRITAAMNKEIEQANAGWDAAKHRLITALNQSSGPRTSPKMDDGGNPLPTPDELAANAGEKEKSPLADAVGKFVPDGAKAADAEVLKQGKFYQHYCKVFQVTNEFLMVDKTGVGEQPWAMLLFADPKKIEGVSVERGGWITAIVQFKEFKSIPMASGGEQRMAIFSCVGFQDFNSSKFINCSPGDTDR